jgi:formate/nitrite transporter FocA (FNT family)
MPDRQRFGVSAEPAPEAELLHVPELTPEHQEQVEERVSPSAHVLHEAIRREADDELARSPSSLWWSGLAAGLSMGFSVVTQGLLRSHLPDAAWRPLVTNFGYTIGFLIVVLGHQQLFTENTVTPIISVLARRDVRTLVRTLRLWLIVLVANLVGAAIFATVIAHTAIFHDDVRQNFAQIGREAAQGGAWTIFLRAIFAGWLIALMVWMLPGTRASEALIIIIMTYVVGLAGLAHVVVGSVEVLYTVANGDFSVAHYFAYLAPTVAGNIVGGVLLVAALNHAQVASGERGKRGRGPRWRRAGQPAGGGPLS